MAELVFLKLGGSLITDKTREATPRLDVIQRAAREVCAALRQRADLRLLLGHGSGSFGHVPAHRYHVRQGCDDWWGFALTAAVAARLNRLVTDIFLAEGVPVVSLSPFASAYCRAGALLELAVRPIRAALDHGLVPLIYGDVAFDEAQGSTIASTEELFVYLTPLLSPRRIILAGEVDGVYTSDPQLDPRAEQISHITTENLAQIQGVLAGSRGVDVTGGMLSKVLTMHRLAQEQPLLCVQILSGLLPGRIAEALLNPASCAGTIIRR